METKEQDTSNAGKELPVENAADVGGGVICSATVSTGATTLSASTMTEALIGTYEGAVDATSHVIERVVTAVKR
jgi:hypothetical protein